MKNSIKSVVLALVTLVFVEASAETAVKLRFPIDSRDRSLISAMPIIGMDHDNAHGTDKTKCTNYRGANAPFCYNDHEGTDYSLIGGFITMDNGSAEVVAAAAGVVTKVEDGNFDRCSIDLSTKDVSCWGHPMKANMVEIKHRNGIKTRYLHLKKNSIRVKVGDQVKCGEFLGLVGSSGRSSLPHLHFDVIDLQKKHVDPYGGRFSQSFDYWREAFMEDGLPSDSCDDSPKKPENQCKWQMVQDAVSCGTETIISSAACGANLYKCGTEIVACGQETVTDAIECGTKVVTDAAKCGVNFVTNLYQCAQQGLAVFSGGCNIPNTCSVAKTCQVTLHCQVDKMCEEAKACQVPKTCKIKVCKK